jgi:hypothetical protein
VCLEKGHQCPKHGFTVKRSMVHAGKVAAAQAAARALECEQQDSGVDTGSLHGPLPSFGTAEQP